MSYRDALEALLTQRKPVHIPFQGRARSARCLYGRIKGSIKWFRENPEELPGITEAARAIQVSLVEDGCILGLKGWIGKSPVNTRTFAFSILDSSVNKRPIPLVPSGKPKSRHVTP